MAGVIATIPKFQFSANGVPMVSGTLTVYLAGTTTPTDTWQDSALSTLNTNPVVLDARGECVLWLDSTKSYKFVLKNASGVIQWTQDNISGADAHLRGDLSASSGSSLVGHISAGTGSVATTVQGALRQFRNLADFGVVGDGVADDTTKIQAAIDSLGTAGGTIGGQLGATYKVTDSLTFAAYGNGQAMRTIDFAGASFVYAGAINKPVLKTFNNRFLTIKNFTIDGANISGVQGVFCDSLQSLGSDHVNLENFHIRRCDIGINLGSVGANQNRVSDGRITSFLIESCNTGIKTNSTNVDSLVISTGIISGCEKHIHLNRAGFIKLENMTGYGAKANQGINAFIYIDGPIGPLVVESSQEENGGFTPMHFLKRTDYTAAVDAPITLVSCSADDDITFNAGAGSGSVVNVVGGYFNNMNIQASDLNVNLVGTRQKAAGTLTVAGLNSFVRRHGSNIAGTQTVTSGYSQAIAANGYVMRPDGLMEQWGVIAPATLAANASRTDTINFPKAFPAGVVLDIQVTPLSNGGASISGWVKDGATGSSFSSAVMNFAGVAQDVGIRWRALGY